MAGWSVLPSHLSFLGKFILQWRRALPGSRQAHFPGSYFQREAGTRVIECYALLFVNNAEALTDLQGWHICKA